MGTLMHERQLADLLIRIGVDRGIDVDQVATELASVAMPRFVDEAAFKASLLEASEAHLRKQMDERIELLRQQLATQGTNKGRVLLEPEPAAQEEESLDSAEPVGHVSLDETNQTVVVDEDLPEDATMVWHTQDERKEN